MKALTYVEIDVPYCSLTYGTAPCTASIPTTGSIKCFNTKRTCQDRENFTDSPQTMRFTLEGVAYAPRDIEAIPSIVAIGINPGQISLGKDLGERSSIQITFKDHRHSDTGSAGDKYLADRSYDPFRQGTFWGKFRNRHLYLKGQSLRLIRGLLGEAIGDMKTRHYVIDSYTGPTTDGSFTITAKDVIKLADNDRAQCPEVSNGYLSADLTDVATTFNLSPSGIGDSEYDLNGYLSIGGKEIVTFQRKASQDANTKLLLHCNGADASTTFTDSSASPHTVTRFGNAQVDTAQSKFGGASALFDGVDDYLQLDGSSDFAFGTGDFTIDVWFRLSSIGAQRTIYDSRPAGGGGFYPTVYVTSANKVRFYTNGAMVLESTTTVAANTWYHVVVARASGTSRLFINGTSEDDAADTNNYINGASRPVIGTDGSTPASFEFIGWIDEVEISKGVARWTSNFVSTQAETSTTSGNTILVTSRGQLNTTAQAHKQDDRVQAVRSYASIDPADILYDLFVNYASVDQSYIDLASWKLETAAYLNRLYTANIAEPTGVNQLASELIEQAALALWWDDLGQKINLQVLRSIPTDAATYDSSKILEGTLNIDEQPELRISEVWTYFNQRNPLEGLTEENNYKSIAVTVDLQRQADYGSAAIKKIYSRWIPNGGRSIALRLNEIQLARYGDPPRAFEFAVFHGENIELGGGYKVGSDFLQDETGAPYLANAQVIRLAEGSEMIRVAAEEVLFDIPESDLNARTIILDTSQNDVNIRTIHDTLYPEITTVGSITLTIIVDAGTIIGSSSTATPAMNIGTFPSGLPILLQVRGRIQGAGGTGGRAVGSNLSAGAGTAGGPALYTRMALDLDVDEGEIWGGGGGGGGASFGPGTVSGSCGGGGAGTIAGLGGTIHASGQVGANGTSEAGGAGGTIGYDGGNGGGPGLAGSAGQFESYGAPAGGAAGAAIDGISYVTVTEGPGDRRGGEIN